MATDKKEYAIVRFKYPDCFNWDKVIKTGLTLSQAQEHCSRPDTREEGKWFDGYTDMKNV